MSDLLRTCARGGRAVRGVPRRAFEPDADHARADPARRHQPHRCGAARSVGTRPSPRGAHDGRTPDRDRRARGPRAERLAPSCPSHARQRHVDDPRPRLGERHVSRRQARRGPGRDPRRRSRSLRPHRVLHDRERRAAADAARRRTRDRRRSVRRSNVVLAPTTAPTILPTSSPIRKSTRTSGSPRCGSACTSLPAAAAG